MIAHSEDRTVVSILEDLAVLFGPWSEQTEEPDWTLDGTDISLIRARTPNGSISLRGTGENVITVRARKTVHAPTANGAETLARYVKIHVRRIGNAIAIHTTHPHPTMGCSIFISYEITAPWSMDANLTTPRGGLRIAEIEGAVQAQTQNGIIDLRGTVGPAKLITGGGKITIRDVEGTVEAMSNGGAIDLQDSSGHINLQTMVGPITLGKMEGTVKASTHSGDIILREGDGAVSLHTDNGNIKATLKKLEQASALSVIQGNIDIQIHEGIAPVIASAENGAIRMAIPPNFSGQLDARSPNGRIHTEFTYPLLAVNPSPHHINAQLGSGGETTVNLQTAKGDIHISDKGKAPQ